MREQSPDSEKTLDGGLPSPDSLSGPGPLLHVLWHRRLTVVAAVLACLFIAGVYLLFATPIYSSTAQLYIEGVAPKAFSDSTGPVEQSEGYLNSQAGLLQSTPVLARALDTVKWRQLKTFKGLKSDPVSALRHGRGVKLTVEVMKKTNIISVSIESAYPEDAAALVNAIVDGYIAQRAVADHSTGQEMIAALQKQQTDLEKQHDACVAAMNRFKADHAIASFRDDKSNIALARSAALSAQLNAADLEVWELAARDNAVKNALSRPEALSAFVQAQQYKDKQAGDREYDDLRAQLVQAELALSTCISVQGRENQRVRLLTAQIDGIRRRIANKERAVAQGYLADLSVQLEAARQKTADLRAAMAG
ncbi:MAG TPA: Wzz/FepE/Etk N-terminal domain-containing protein [Tepidisphaeraceae bacterium]|nr:Wzz/FepE/Etk N-terminal domain-containing protein [Tepidisphaeraceae bacterium]